MANIYTKFLFFLSRHRMPSNAKIYFSFFKYLAQDKGVINDVEFIQEYVS